MFNVELIQQQKNKITITHTYTLIVCDAVIYYVRMNGQKNVLVTKTRLLAVSA